MIMENLNPFAITDSEHLFNIASGNSANEKTEECLLNIYKVGNQARLKFISECIKSPERFEMPIKKQKLYTFATEVGKTRIENKKDGKLVETCLLRDLFGSILFVSTEES